MNGDGKIKKKPILKEFTPECLKNNNNKKLYIYKL